MAKRKKPSVSLTGNSGVQTSGSKKSQKRNLHACHPIMRKGGVHEKSTSAKRSADKRKTSKEVKKAAIDYFNNGDSRFSFG